MDLPRVFPNVKLTHLASPSMGPHQSLSLMGLLRCLTATSADDGCGGVDAGGDADVGVAEEFLDGDEVDTLFQKQSRGRVLAKRRG